MPAPRNDLGEQALLLQRPCKNGGPSQLVSESDESGLFFIPGGEKTVLAAGRTNAPLWT